jgi:hypothetical protein
MKHSCIILLYLFILLFGTKAFAQWTPSIYTGWGLGTNLGGEIGVGSEIKYKRISFNVAVGSLLGESFLDYADSDAIGSYLRLDYDLGVKLYADFGGFLGVNYGIIAASTCYTAPDLPQLKSEHGFSFTLGYRHSIYKNFYGLGFIGLTSNKKYNYIEIPLFRRSVFGDKYFFPRIGLILGYEFKTRKK